MAATAARILTQHHLNRALLARQLLLRRTSTTPARALERIGGLQAQYAPSMYLGLWSRLEGFERDGLTRALERGTVVQGTLMRATIHLVSGRDYWPFVIAIRRSRRESWLRSHHGGPTAREIGAAARRLRGRLAEGPLHRSEIDRLVGKGSVGTNGVGLWLDLVRVPPAGTWERRRADLYAAAEEWLGPADVTPREGLEHLVRRYLGGFGPGSPSEIADWTGVPIKQIAPTLERLHLRRFRATDGEELLDLPRAPLPDPKTPAPVRFLPAWDSTLLVHTRRTGILPEEYRPMVFNPKTPHSAATFLVDGAVAGAWKYDERKVRLEPFKALSRSIRRELEEEADRLAAFHA